MLFSTCESSQWHCCAQILSHLRYCSRCETSTREQMVVISQLRHRTELLHSLKQISVLQNIFFFCLVGILDQFILGISDPSMRVCQNSLNYYIYCEHRYVFNSFYKLFEFNKIKVVNVEPLERELIKDYPENDNRRSQST